jgi:hypothetical protein
MVNRQTEHASLQKRNMQIVAKETKERGLFQLPTPPTMTMILYEAN